MPDLVPEITCARAAIGVVLLRQEEGGKLAAYGGIDLAAVKPLGEGEQRLRIDDDALDPAIRRQLRLNARQLPLHIGGIDGEGRVHVVLRHLPDALVILGAIPRDGETSGLVEQVFDGHDERAPSVAVVADTTLVESPADPQSAGDESLGGAR